MSNKMADKRMDDFATVDNLHDDDKLLVASDEETYNVTVETLKDTVRSDLLEQCYREVIIDPDVVSTIAQEVEEEIAQDVITLKTLAVQQNARIDNLILNATGDSEGNAELIDVRAGFDGSSYLTAGTAVRNQVKSLYGALGRKRGLNEMSWDKDNMYKQGEVVKTSGYIRGYDVNQSPVTPVFSNAAGYEVWKISMEGLSDLEIPLLPEYPDEQCRVLMMLRPADGIMLLRSGLSTASSSWLNLDEKSGVIKLSNLSYWYKQGYTELYVTLLTGKGDVYTPSSITEYIGENTIRTSSLVEQAELVVYNQLRLAEGEEFTVYADNILLHDSIKNYAAVEIVPSGITNCVLQEGRVTFNGSNISSSGGTLTFNYYKNDTAHVSLSKKVSVYRVNKTAGTGKTIRCHVIGDSITNAGFYLQKVTEKLATDPLNVNFLGSNPSSSTANGKEFTWSTYKGQTKPPADGLSGWSAYSLTHCQAFNGFTNPFYNPDTYQAFDYSYYMKQQGYDGVEMVLLNLGMNGVTVAVNGTYPTYEQDLAAYKTIINNIKSYDSNIKILLWLTPLPCQEITADILQKDKRLTIHKQLIDTYSNSYTDGVYIYNAGMCCESRPLAYTQTETEECAGIDTSTDQTPTMQRVTDKLHPRYPGPGYRQMASMVYSVIKWIAPQCTGI